MDILNEIDVGTVEGGGALEWTNAEFEKVQTKINRLHAAVHRIKASRDDEDKKMKTEAAAAKDDGFIPTEVIRRVSLSGFLSSEELGRLLLFTRKLFAHNLTPEFVFRAANFARSDQFHNCVPASITQAHGVKWLYEQMSVYSWKGDEQPDLHAFVASELQHPTTLTAKNLTLYLKILQWYTHCS